MTVHTHAHSHAHSHAHPHQSFNQAFAIAILLNLAYIACEIVYALLANSTSLLADAAHNFGDVLGLMLAWMANWLLSIRARKRYSYGFKRTTIIAALINAFILVATSALIMYESIYKFFHITHVNEVIVIWVGLLGIAVNAGSSLLFMRGRHDDLNIRGAFLHLVADALILVGVVLGAIVMHYTGWYWVDPVLSIAIVVVILWGTWGLLRDSLSLILDGMPRYIDHAGVMQYLTNLPGVVSVHDLHIWGLSTREAALTVHLVRPSGALSDDDYRRINETLHETFHIDHATIQVEQGTHVDSCRFVSTC